MSTWSYHTRNNKTTAFLVKTKPVPNIFQGTAPPAPRFQTINPSAMNNGAPLPPVIYEAANSLQSETAALASELFTSFGSAGGVLATTPGRRTRSSGRSTTPSTPPAIAISAASMLSGSETATTSEAPAVQTAIVPAAATPVPAPAQDPIQNTKPKLSSLAASSEVTTTTTDFSFCLPSSLAFFKTLTWEQTPWIPHYIDGKPVSPLSLEDATVIKTHLRRQLGPRVSVSAIMNALFLGSAYPITTPPGSLGTYPHVFVVFPHAKTCVATNARFLRTWHDEVVKPAFDYAWKDSGKATIYGAEKSGKPRILLPSGVRTANDAAGSEGLLTLLHNNAQDAVRVRWPTWPNTESDARASIMDEAWEAMKGIIKDHPNLAEFQDPILLAVGRGEYAFSPAVQSKGMFKDMALEWEKYVDARFVEAESFRVLVQSVIGVAMDGWGEEEGDETEDEFMVDWVYGVQQAGNASKRPAKKEVGESRDGEEDGHRHKRRRA